MPRSGPLKHSGVPGSRGDEAAARDGTPRLKPPVPGGLFPLLTPGDVLPDVARPAPFPVAGPRAAAPAGSRLGAAGTDKSLPCSSSRRMLQVAKDSELEDERFSESRLWSFFCLVRRFWNQTLT